PRHPMSVGRVRQTSRTLRPHYGENRACGTLSQALPMNPFLLLLFPLAEIAGFILVGRVIGIMPTLLLIVASTALGTVLLRDAGLATLVKLQRGSETPEKVLSEGGTRML